MDKIRLQMESDLLSEPPAMPEPEAIVPPAQESDPFKAVPQTPPGTKP